MAKRYTFEELLDILSERGYLVETTIERMMAIIEEETGEFPEWTDIAPDWVVRNCLG